MAKSRKWTNLKGHVPDAPVEVSERELKVRAEADQHRAGLNDDGTPRKAKTMSELALEWQDLEEEEAFADRAAKERSIKFDALDRVILEQLNTVKEVSGQDSWRGEGQLFSPKTVLYPSVEDKVELMKFIKDQNLEALLTLADGKLRELVVEKIEEIMTMTPGQRAELAADALTKPIPGVKLYTKTSVHRTTS